MLTIKAGFVMLSAAKHLSARRARPVAALRVTSSLFADVIGGVEEVLRMLLSKCLYLSSERWYALIPSPGNYPAPPRPVAKPRYSALSGLQAQQIRPGLRRSERGG